MKLGSVLIELVTQHNALLAKLDAVGTPLVPATCTATIADATITAGDTVRLALTNAALTVSPQNSTYTLKASDTPTTIAAGLAALINANPVLAAAGVSATNAAAVVTVSHKGAIGNASVLSQSVTGGRASVTLSNSGSLTGGAGVLGVTNAVDYHVRLPNEYAL